MITAFTFIFFSCLQSFSYGATPTAQELLVETDRSRGAIESGAQWESFVTNVDSEGEKKYKYFIRIRGVDALAEATEPPRSKGETMLFNDRNIWFFKPGLKKPIAISPRQKLTGQASNGDIASTNYARDYAGTIVGSETVNGQECFKLELKAKAKNVTYDGIRYWITKETKLGIKAEFLTIGGDVFKIASIEYENKIKDKNNQTRPMISKLTITDALNPKHYTIIKYETIQVIEQPAKIFNINNISR